MPLYEQKDRKFIPLYEEDSVLTFQPAMCKNLIISPIIPCLSK